MITEFNAQQDLERIQASLGTYRELFDTLGSDWTVVAESVSMWCIAQHMYHALLATDLGLANVLSLVREKGLLIRPEGELIDSAHGVLSASKTERGAVQAPRMVQPGEHVTREQVETEFANVNVTLEGLQNPPRPLEGCPGWIKHQVLGPMNASHWMRFCKMHADHHLDIMLDIRKALQAS